MLTKLTKKSLNGESLQFTANTEWQMFPGKKKTKLNNAFNTKETKVNFNIEITKKTIN